MDRHERQDSITKARQKLEGNNSLPTGDSLRILSRMIASRHRKNCTSQRNNEILSRDDQTPQTPTLSDQT